MMLQLIVLHMFSVFEEGVNYVFVEQLAREISEEEQIPLDEAMETVKRFLKVTLETLDIGQEVEFFVQSNPSDRFQKCFIKRVSENELQFARR